jgi:hypothetical protein
MSHKIEYIKKRRRKHTIDPVGFYPNPDSLGSGKTLLIGPIVEKTFGVYDKFFRISSNSV